MRIFVTGTRGIPKIPGGVEKHCEELYPRIVSKGHTVLCSTRSSYVKTDRKEWRNVILVKCFAPRIKSLEAIIHTFISILIAKRYRPDLIHIHANGPSLLTPLARLLGFSVVVTNHGPEYNREKWGPTAKFCLKLGEKFGCIFANEVIAISKIIQDIIQVRCYRKAHLIYNGVNLPVASQSSKFLASHGIKINNYITCVARFVPEKGLHDLITAFKKISAPIQLVIAGGADHETQYSRQIRKMAQKDSRIILTGYISGESLNQVFTHARLFVLPSYHEGLPIALLEAMSYNLPVLVSDIPPNKEIGLRDHRYYRCGDIDDLVRCIQLNLEKGLNSEEIKEIRSILEYRYDWDKISEQTIAVYRKAFVLSQTQGHQPNRDSNL
jgi:glycosyltransferase involved in cell wall biosynthesis